MEDYVHCVLVYITQLPALLLSLPTLPKVIQLVTSALSCMAPQTQMTTIDVLSHFAKLASTPAYWPAILPIFRTYGKPLLSLLLNGLVRDFPEEAQDGVPSILAVICAAAPGQGEAEQWVAEVMGEIPGHVLPAEAKGAFVAEIGEVLAVAAGAANGPSGQAQEGAAAQLLSEGEGRRGKVSQAVNGLVRAVRRARERGRQARKSLGANV